MKRCLHREHFSGSQRFASYMRRHIPQQAGKSEPENGLYDSQVIKIINVFKFMKNSGSFYSGRKYLLEISSGFYDNIIQRVNLLRWP